MDLEEFVGRLDGVRPSGQGYTACCPHHGDTKPSLMVKAGEDVPIVFHCHVGCSPEKILATMGLSWADIGAKQHEVARYPYTDGQGNTLYEVVRYACPKDFRCHPKLPPKSERVLFGRAWIEHARNTGEPIYVVEGEKDAVNLQRVGVPATCNVNGAGSWYEHYATELAGLHVVVVADNDEPGAVHARDVAASLANVAASVSLARPRFGKDVSDHLEAGGGVAELDPLPAVGDLLIYSGQDLRPRKVRWAWAKHMALGAVTIIDGDPGDGKSVLTCDLAARWTSGAPMPDGSANPFGRGVVVAMISAEDDPEDTISPRLRAAGADMANIRVVAGGYKPGEPFDLTAHLAALEALLARHEVRVLTLDPIMAFLGGTTDSANDASVRRAIGPLAVLARRYGVAVVVVRHLNKNSGGKAIYRGGGSIAFVGAARAAYLVSQHPDDDTARVLAPVKNNLARKGAALVYRLTEDPLYEVPRLEWLGPLETTAQELLDGDGEAEKPREVADYLVGLCYPTALAWKDIETHGKAAGYSANALKTARGRVLEKRPGPHGNRDVVWGLKEGVVPLEGRRAPLEGPLEGAPSSGKGAPDQAKEADQFPTFATFGFQEGRGGGNGASGDDTPSELTDDERRDLELRAKPNTCDVCGQLGVKFAGPHWVVRCKAHNPLTYTATGGA